MKKLLAGLVAAGALLGAGLAYATIPDSSGVIHGCIANNGQLSVIDTDKGPVVQPEPDGPELEPDRASGTTRAPRGSWCPRSIRIPNAVE